MAEIQEPYYPEVPKPGSDTIRYGDGSAHNLEAITGAPSHAEDPEAEEAANSTKRDLFKNLSE